MSVASIGGIFSQTFNSFRVVMNVIFHVCSISFQLATHAHMM